MATRQMSTIFLALLFIKAFVSVCAAHDIVKPQSTWQLQDTAADGTHEASWCSLFKLCFEREDGQALANTNTVEAVTWQPCETFSKKVQSHCPTGNVCCTEDQFEFLRQSVQQAVPFLVGSSACLPNFLKIFCELNVNSSVNCSPDRSLSIDVVSVNRDHDRESVDGSDSYVNITST